MSKKKKYDKVKIEPKKIWEIGKGHAQHLSGSGEHDNRPKRRRTRAARNRAAMKEWQ